MVDSTSLSARLNAEEMHDLIGAYQETVATAVKRFGGYVAKFLGDGVLAYFGWPMAYEDHCRARNPRGSRGDCGGRESSGRPLDRRFDHALGSRVAAWSWAILPEAGRSTAAKWRARRPISPHAFRALAGAGADPDREHRPGASPATLSNSRLLACELKGFPQRMPAFRVASERDVESRFDATRSNALSQFVGRNSEIGILLDRWELAKGGQGQMVFVSGEAGIGKSRLLEALVQRLHGEPHELIRLQCSPYHTTSALYPLIQRLSSASVGLAADDDAATRAEKPDRLLARYGEIRGRRAAGLCRAAVARFGPRAPNWPIFPLSNARSRSYGRSPIAPSSLRSELPCCSRSRMRIGSTCRPTSFCGTSFCGCMGHPFTCC